MWNDIIEPPNPANVDDINVIIRNQNKIIEKLLNLNLIDSNEVPTENIRADYSILYAFVQEVYYFIDEQFELINNGDWKSVYYETPTNRLYEPNRKEWQMWIDTLNDLWEIVNGKKGKWEYLVCYDGYATISGKKILVQGEKINGV